MVRRRSLDDYERGRPVKRKEFDDNGEPVPVDRFIADEPEGDAGDE